jgi:hypothetical protein
LLQAVVSGLIVQEIISLDNNKNLLKTIILLINALYTICKLYIIINGCPLMNPGPARQGCNGVQGRSPKEDMSEKTE